MFTFVDTPSRFPHCCMSCGGSSDRVWFLDLGEDLNSPNEEILPTLYICNLCFTAFAQEKGLVDEKPLLEEIERLKAELFDSKVKAEALEQMINGAFRAKFIDSSDPAVHELVSFLETPKPGEENQQGAGEGVVSGTGDVAQSSDDPDLARLHSAFEFDGGTGD